MWPGTSTPNFSIYGARRTQPPQPQQPQRPVRHTVTPPPEVQAARAWARLLGMDLGVGDYAKPRPQVAQPEKRPRRRLPRLLRLHVRQVWRRASLHLRNLLGRLLA